MQGQSREEDGVYILENTNWVIILDQFPNLRREIKENKIICLRQESNLAGVWWIKTALK